MNLMTANKSHRQRERAAPQDLREGFWALSAVRDYLARIEAEPSSINSARVSIAEGRYSRDKANIRFERDGAIRASQVEYAPTEQEQAAIKAAVAAAGLAEKLPRHIPAGLNNKPAQLCAVRAENLFTYKNMKGDEIIAYQERRESPEGKRSFHWWTFYSDGEWRMLEPEKLPLYGLENLKGNTRVFLHEGAKAARYVNNLLHNDAPPARELAARHPWRDDLMHAAHLGWAGGATNPDRTDWSPLRDARSIREVIIVADNDDPGRDAVPTIARQLNVATYVVQFPSKFPEGFDLADEFPAKLFAKVPTVVSNTVSRKAEEKFQYIGPSLMDCLKPATWLTSVDALGKSKRPTYKLRRAAKGQWAFISGIEKFAHIPRPEMRYNAETLRRILMPFADQNPVPLIEKTVNRQVAGLCYRPDAHDEKFIETPNGTMLNTFRQADLKPVKGDVTPWLNCLERMFPIKEEREVVARLCATLIAQPAIRVHFALLLISKMQGTGKSTLVNVLKRLVGTHNCSEPTAHQVVESQYNDWMICKRLVAVHEIYEGHSRKAYNILKSKISEETAQTHIRYENSWTVDNWATFFLCSNELDALKIDIDDRRIFAPEVTEEKWCKDGPDGATAFYAWLDAGGDRIILNWALEYNDYLPSHSNAPPTARKDEIIEESKSAIVVYGEMIAETMLNGLGRAQPMAVMAHDVLARATEIHPRAWAPSPLNFNSTMAKTGLAYMKERIKVDGVLTRLLLNRAAVKQIEEEHNCFYSERSAAFLSKEAGGSPLPITKISVFLRKIIRLSREIEQL